VVGGKIAPFRIMMSRLETKGVEAELGRIEECVMSAAEKGGSMH